MTVRISNLLIWGAGGQVLIYMTGYFSVSNVQLYIYTHIIYIYLYVLKIICIPCANSWVSGNIDILSIITVQFLC